MTAEKEGAEKIEKEKESSTRRRRRRRRRRRGWWRRRRRRKKKKVHAFEGKSLLVSGRHTSL